MEEDKNVPQCPVSQSQYQSQSQSQSQSQAHSQPSESSPMKNGTTQLAQFEEAAVEVKDVYHSYHSRGRANPILQGLDMTVPSGCIYGLLGPSGCGKTTLLKIIVGCLVPDKGCVEIFGIKPRDPRGNIPGAGIGYMPQETALYMDITIGEMLSYFGRLYLMDMSLIESQINYLVKTMDLPERNRLVSELSGGQKRRVSFAASLIHEPSLVILDEPTAGVDPMLRDAIWKLLRRLSREKNMTIIVTTHYIEEARQADRVGLMRKGMLLAEEAPQVLMEKYKKKTLEDVFLRMVIVRKMSIVCPEKLPPSEYLRNISENQKRQERKRSMMSSLGSVIKSRNLRKKGSGLWRWYTLMMTIFWRNNILTIRQPQILISQYVMPLIQLIFFCICIGGDPFDVRVGVVLDESPPGLGLLFVQNIDPYVVSLKYFPTLESAREETRKTNLWGYLHIKENFSVSLLGRPALYEEDTAIEADEAKSIMTGSQIAIYADLTNKVVSLTTMRSLEQSYQKFMKEVYRKLKLDPNQVRPPLEIPWTVFGDIDNKHHGFTKYMAPGILLNLIFTTGFSITLIVFILDKVDQMFVRNYVAGVTSSQIMAAHFLNRVIFAVGQVVFMLVVTVYVFDIPCKGSTICALLLLFVQGLAGNAFGLLLSCFCDTTMSAVGAAIGFLFFTLVMSGMMWPVQAIPRWFKWFSQMHPSTIAMDSLRAVLSRGWTFGDPDINLGFYISFGWILVCVLLGFKVFRYD